MGWTAGTVDLLFKKGVRVGWGLQGATPKGLPRDGIPGRGQPLDELDTRAGTVEL